MPTTLQLTDGTLTVDMVTNADVKLSANYLPVFSTPAGDGTIPGEITESLPVYIYVADDDDLSDTLQDVARLGRYAAEYRAKNHQTPVWFYRQMQDESNAVRTLVQSVSFTPDARFAGLFDRAPCITEGRTGVLTITHHPYNEAVSAVAASGSNGVSVIGGTVNYTDVVGDVNARLYYLNIDNIATARVYRRVWAGFRSDRRAGGDAGNVASLWELELGAPGSSSGVTTDPTASPGGAGNTKVNCNFSGGADAGWANRLSILMSDVTANYGNQVGAFVVLLRAQVDTGAAQVKIQQYNNNAAVYREGPTVDVDATGWTLYNLGTCEFPGRDLHATPTALFAATYDQRDGFEIWARVKPGAAVPSLDMDCLILIPADEYLIQVQSAEASGAASNQGDKIYVMIAPEDTARAMNIDAVSSYFNIHCPVSVIGAGIPAGDGRLFIAIANDNAGTAPTFSDTVDVELSTYPRWVHFRGND